MTYRTGDHLAVLPRNPPSLVARVATRFGLDLQQAIALESGRRGLPVGEPVTVGQLLTEFVELRFPPSAISVAALAEQGWDVPQAQGNFVWLPLGEDAVAFAAACAEQALTVRPFAGDGVRCTVAEPEANDRLLAITAEWKRARAGA